MFFLLAAFMIVSIHKIKVKSLKVSLPTDVPVSQLEPKEDFISVSINAQGQVQIDKELVTDPNALLSKLQALYVKNKDQKFLISADKDSRNGDVIAVLGKLRIAGFQKVGFNLKPGGAMAPVPPSSAAAPAAAPTEQAEQGERTTEQTEPGAPAAPTAPVAPTPPAAAAPAAPATPVAPSAPAAPPSPPPNP